MKKVILLFVGAMACAAGFSQESVTIRGFFEPNGTYTGDGSNSMNLSMKVVGDSTVLQEMAKDSSMPNAITMATNTQHKMVTTTGKMNNDSTFSVKGENHYNSRMNIMGKIDTSIEGAIFMYGFAKRNEMPHYDSIRTLHETKRSDSESTALAQAFQDMGNSMFPHKEFHIGDTASISITMPLQLFSLLKINIFVTQIYKLVKIENGLAYFDISASMKFGFSGKDTTIAMQGDGGTGSASGQCVYDIRNGYFKSIAVQMNFSIPVTMDVQEHLEMVATVEIDTKSNTSFQAIN